MDADRTEADCEAVTVGDIMEDDSDTFTDTVTDGADGVFSRVDVVINNESDGDTDITGEDIDTSPVGDTVIDGDTFPIVNISEGVNMVSNDDFTK